MRKVVSSVQLLFVSTNLAGSMIRPYAVVNWKGTRAMLGALISGGLSLLSGLGSRQSAKKQQKLQAAYEYVNKVRQEEQNAANERNFQFAQAENREIGQGLVERFNPRNIAADADAAGFNPVTFLNAFGGTYGAMLSQGYGLMQAQAFQGQAYMMNAPTAQVPSMLEVVGNAASAGFNTYRSDMRVQQSQDFQREMLLTQLGAMPGGSRYNVDPLTGRPYIGSSSFFGSGARPYSVTAGARTVGDAIARAAPVSIPLGLSAWKPGGVDVTNPFADRQPVAPVADGQSFTTRYPGEIAENIVGAKTFLDDMSWRINGRTWWTGVKQNYRELFGYPVYPDGARGLSWGLPDASYSPGLLPGFGYRTGSQF